MQEGIRTAADRLDEVDITGREEPDGAALVTLDLRRHRLGMAMAAFVQAEQRRLIRLEGFPELGFQFSGGWHRILLWQERTGAARAGSAIRTCPQSLASAFDPLPTFG